MSIRKRWAFAAVVLFVVLGAAAHRAWLLRAAAPFWVPVTRVAPPVEGAVVRSTWHAPRPGGRSHEGIDLFARRGTPVRSATRGVVWKVGDDPLGGRVVTVLGDGPAFYYYAHLDGFADGLKVGDRVKPGVPLGTVGNTGNARTTPPHLHFGVYRIGTFRTRAVDPARLLR